MLPRLRFSLKMEMKFRGPVFPTDEERNIQRKEVKVTRVKTERRRCWWGTEWSGIPIFENICSYSYSHSCSERKHFNPTSQTNIYFVDLYVCLKIVKEHICWTHGHGQRWPKVGGQEAGWRWTNGEKVGTTVVALTIKNFKSIQEASNSDYLLEVWRLDGWDTGEGGGFSCVVFSTFFLTLCFFKM